MGYLAVGYNDIQQRHDPVRRGKFVIVVPLRILKKVYTMKNIDAHQHTDIDMILLNHSHTLDTKGVHRSVLLGID